MDIVHQDNIPVFYASHDRIDRGLRISGLPVQRIDIPQDHRHSHASFHRRTDCPVRRTHQGGSLPYDILEIAIGPSYFILYAGCIQFRQIGVVVGMIA